MFRLILALGVLAACSAPSASQTPPSRSTPAAAVPVDRIYDYQVVATYPHDPDAFTQGLLFHDGQLFESTGQVGRSSIRKVDLSTGKVLQKRDVDGPYFGEGIVAWKDRLIALTWRHQKGFVYDLQTFERRGEWSYPGEGWGLTQDGRRLIMSDGTPDLRFLDPETLLETGRIRVTYNGKPVGGLNELEWIKGEIWANVWTTDLIVRIDPATGQVIGRVPLAGLLKPEDRVGGNPDVLNGIAYDAKQDRIFVTGKQWPKLFEIRITPRAP
jgi:glutaminyl-peptide cyclotransferase